MDTECPVCGAAALSPFREVDGYAYFACEACGSLPLDPAVLREVDEGRRLVGYSEVYWRDELASARSRAYGPGLARVAETFLYARRPIEVFLDVGTGPGFLLDACATYLPASRLKFHGIEKYPPETAVSTHPNMRVGELADFPHRIDAGSCIEVIEHLTPRMASGLLADLAAVANDGAAIIVNSGQPAYVRHEDPAYLDPTRRGHLVSYSLEGFARLAEPHGFRVHALPGKTWAFLLEKSASREPEDVAARIWSALPENVATLDDPVMGSVLHVLGIETARAYG